MTNVVKLAEALNNIANCLLLIKTPKNQLHLCQKAYDILGHYIRTEERRNQTIREDTP